MNPFHTSVYAYPWDVVDESVETFCRNAREQLGVDTISLAVSYHAAKLILPHNPRRKVYYPEDGSVYFQPDLAAFADSPIQPHVGKLALEQDVLAELCQSSAKAGLEIIAWTVCLHNTRLGSAYPEYAPVNAFGDPSITYLCPAQPAARAYTRALAGDLARRYPLKAIQLEAAHHMPFVHGFHHEMQQVRVTPALQILLGLCFCPACLALAREHGVDGARVRRYVADDIQARLTEGGGESDEAAWLAEYWRGQLDGELGRYILLRRLSTNTLLREVRQAVQAVSTTPVYLQEASAVGAPAHSPVLDLAWHLGMSVPPAEGTCDGLSVLGYFAGLDRFTAEMDAYRAAIPTDLPLEIGLRACIPDCDSLEELTAKVAHCVAVGARGVSFYNYGMMPAVRRDWVREALSRVRGN
ncbi:MAG TPA: hypothetical protein VNL35_17145 [Chloroflexota bacterium]|nr:hypothetical protein [Chloroflexota bacterium]